MALFNRDSREAFQKGADRKKSGGPATMVGSAVAVEVIGELPETVKGDGLALNVRVLNSADPKLPVGSEVAVTITGGSTPKPGQKILDNLLQGEKRGKITADRLVLEGVQVSDDGAVTARWPRKAGGAQREIQEGLWGPQIISFRAPVQMESGTRNRNFRIAGYGSKDSPEYRAKQREALAGTAARLEAAIVNGDEKAIQENRITVARNRLMVEMATECQDGNLINNAIQNAAIAGASMVALRFYDRETNEVAVAYVNSLWKIRNEENPDKCADLAQEAFDDAMTNLYAKGPEAGAFIEAGDQRGSLAVEAIPMEHVTVPFNDADASKNGTLAEVKRYLATTDSAANYLDALNGPGEYTKALVIRTQYVSDEGDTVLGGMLQCELMADQHHTLASVPTAHFAGGTHLRYGKEGTAPAAEESAGAGSRVDAGAGLANDSQAIGDPPGMADDDLPDLGLDGEESIEDDVESPASHFAPRP